MGVLISESARVSVLCLWLLSGAFPAKEESGKLGSYRHSLHSETEEGTLEFCNLCMIPWGSWGGQAGAGVAAVAASTAVLRAHHKGSTFSM